MTLPPPPSWFKVTPAGLYCEPGDFYIDPLRPVDRAVISHGHTDHARPGHRHVLATAATLAIMRTRFGTQGAGLSQQALAYGEAITIGGVRLWLRPAGHVLGSAQICLEWRGFRIVVSGDYKRRPDPTCAAFEAERCDLFVTEATFALPIFRHPPAEGEIARLLQSVALFPDRSHLIGCYNLGKCQRLIMALRQAGWERPIYLHGAQLALCHLYEALGLRLGPLAPALAAHKEELRGAIVLAPPSAAAEPWVRRLPDPVIALASGWMRVRQRAKQRRVELPLVISDHADWDEILATCEETGARTIWVSHGQEEALVHVLRRQGVVAQALHLAGRGEEDEESA